MNLYWKGIEKVTYHTHLQNLAFFPKIKPLKVGFCAGVCIHLLIY